MMNRLFFRSVCALSLAASLLGAQDRMRFGEAGFRTGSLPSGNWNAITDVPGVRVGHRTLVEGSGFRTGVTVILPHDGNLFREKVPAAVSVGNGFGKLIGSTQVKELGYLESPVALTSTLNVFRVADGLVDYLLGLPGNGNVRSVNPVVGETNDGWLNDNRSRPVTRGHVQEALMNAAAGPVQEGNVGAGTGTRCLGFKGGIGTASRVLPGSDGGYSLGVLVQTNFGGRLTILGNPVWRFLEEGAGDAEERGGSCMIVIATDAPLQSRQLERLCKRSFLALGRVGSHMSHGSGDYAIAFSTDSSSRWKPLRPGTPLRQLPLLPDEALNPLFRAVVEATEEAIYNSLFMAEEMTGRNGNTARALPLDRVREILSAQGEEGEK